MNHESENVGIVPHASDIQNLRKDVDSLHGSVKSMVDKFDEIKPVCDLIEAEGTIIQKVKAAADKNKDGITTPKEYISWGGEMLNGEGFKMLLITLLSITFDYVYGYLLTLFAVHEGGILTLIGKLIAFTIVTYGYKTVLGKVDKSKDNMAQVINAKDKEIEMHKQDKQANRLAIELLRHDNDIVCKENKELKKEVERLRQSD